MVIKNLPVGQLETNCYIIGDEETNSAAVIDPGDEPDSILEHLEDINVPYIILTHGHFDHAGAVGDIQEATGAKIILHEKEVEIYSSVKAQGAYWGFSMPDLPPYDLLVKDGDSIEMGGLSFMVIHTPGHTPGSMCLYVGGVLISGDTLFAGSVGRTDFPGGSMSQMKQSFRRLMTLPDETTVLPGHGAGTTIERERIHNMFAPEFLS